jgi:hypothetical protein
MIRTLGAFATIFAAAFLIHCAHSAEPLPAPAPLSASVPLNANAPATASEAQSDLPPLYDPNESHRDPSIVSDPRFFPAIFAQRRYGPVEEPEQEFYTLRNPDAPGFEWNPPGPSWGWGFGGWRGWGWGGWGWRGAWPGWGWPTGGWRGFGWNPGFGYNVPRAGFSFAGYNRYAYRPWYASPSQTIYTNRYPWYTPQGAGPNIYQPWYSARNSLPWYSPYGVGPNIYTPTYLWRNYYPWYSPNGPGPNIYTPPAELEGCFVW